jgi:uncharacterized protein (DUF302 family)
LEAHVVALNETLYSSHNKIGECDSNIVQPEHPMPASIENGIIHLRSPYAVPETLTRLESVLASRGLSIFASIDHSGEAEKVGMKMNATRLIIFGSPKGGTPAMIAAPTLAIDLPMKALIWEDSEHMIWISYNSAEYLRQRHHIPEDFLKTFVAIEPPLHSVVQ